MPAAYYKQTACLFYNNSNNYEMRLYRILHEKKIPAPAQDVVTLIRHFLGRRGFLVERKNWDETRFRLNFCFSFTYGESKPFHPVWGGVELIQWSDGTEIVSMSQTTPLGGAPRFFPRQFLNGEDEAAEQLELLEELSDAILEKFDKAREPAAAKPERSIEHNSLQTKWNAMSDETKSNFRKAWKIWGRMRKEYRREFSDGQTKDAQPKIKDWQTKVMEDLHWDVSESRLRDVKEMGEAGVIR